MDPRNSWQRKPPQSRSRGAHCHAGAKRKKEAGWMIECGSGDDSLPTHSRIQRNSLLNVSIVNALTQQASAKTSTSTYSAPHQIRVSSVVEIRDSES
jgi:hypothetical protein